MHSEVNELGQTVVVLEDDEAVFGVSKEGKIHLFLPQERPNEENIKVPEHVFNTALAATILHEDNEDLLTLLNSRFLARLALEAEELSNVS